MPPDYLDALINTSYLENLILALTLTRSLGANPQKAEERNKTNKELLHASLVRLSLDADLLTLAVSTDQGERHWAFERAKGQFSCKGGILSLKHRGDDSGDNVAAIGWLTIDLFIVGNDLMVHTHR